MSFNMDPSIQSQFKGSLSIGITPILFLTNIFRYRFVSPTWTASEENFEKVCTST